MARRDYRAIEEEYIEGWDSLRALADKYAIPRTTLRDRARRELWAEKRSLRRAQPPAPPPEKSAPEGGGAERILRVTDKLVRRAEEILDGGGEVGARELGELMRAIKNAKEIRMLRSELDEREQQARVRALEEKLSSAADEPLRVEFSPEAEEAAQ